MHEYLIRKAALPDTDFLATAIIAAEKSGADKLGLSALFDIPEETVHSLLCNMLEEEVDECEFSVSSFLIATYNNEPAAAVAGWIEGMDQKIKSAILKSNLIGYYFPKESIKLAHARHNIISGISIDRETLSLQIEYVYTDKDHRGKGLGEALIAQHIENARFSYPALKKVQVQMFSNNEAAIRLYGKCGFNIKQYFTADNTQILDYLPHNEKLLMEIEL